jgi:DNA-binding GntR family transcriptional regulator
MSSEMGSLPRTAQATVREYLRGRILAGEFAPGSRLAQSELARTLNVSITPVREALRDLSMEGLVDVDPFRGAVVHVPSYEELESIFAVRQRLVPLSVELGVVNIRSDELEECESLVKEMEAASDWVEWSMLNRDFHNILDQASRNRPLANILRQLSDVAALYVHRTLENQADRRAVAQSEHRDILDAFARGDADRALDLFLAHFDGTLRIARNHLMTGAANQT